VTLFLLVCCAVTGPLVGQPHKFDGNNQVGFAAMVPIQLGEWRQVSLKAPASLPDQLNINELYQALYSHPRLGQIALTLEYTSDSRREFELHYADICHSVRGDRVVPYLPLDLVLSDGGSIQAALMNWQQQGDGYNAITAYWYTTPAGVTINSQRLKIQQALAGLFSRPEAAVMVRFDAFYEQPMTPQKRSELITAITEFSYQFETGIDSRANTLLYSHLSQEEI
jgi:EpsI family protein